MDVTSGTRQKIFYSFGQVAAGAYNGINNSILGIYLSGYTSSPFIIGYVGNTRSVEGVVIQPIVGRWSDRTTNPLGRRKPFILAGIPLAVLFLVLLPIFGHLHHGLALPLIIVAGILFSVAWNIASDPYSALMVDITRPRERPVFNSILSVMSLLAQVGVVAYTAIAALKKNQIPDLVFYIAAVVIVLSYLLVFFGVREPRQAVEVARVEERVPLREYIAEMRAFKEAFKLLLSVFFLWNGLNALLPYLGVFPIKIVHASKSQALLVYLTLILTAAICAYPFGRLARRYGNRRLIVLGTLMLIAAAIIGLVVPNLALLFPLAILAGAGFSATTALTSPPYLSELVPASRIGAFIGLQTSFQAVGVPLTVALTAGLIDLFGWRSIFVMLALMMVADVLCLLWIDEDAAREQVARVEAQERAVAGPELPVPT